MLLLDGRNFITTWKSRDLGMEEFQNECRGQGKKQVDKLVI